MARYEVISGVATGTVCITDAAYLAQFGQRPQVVATVTGGDLAERIVGFLNANPQPNDAP